MDVDYEIDVDELNERWTEPASIDAWSQFIMKQSEDVVELITAAPASGRLATSTRAGSASSGRTSIGTRSAIVTRPSISASPGRATIDTGRRPRDPGDKGPVDGRRPRAHGPRPGLDPGIKAAFRGDPVEEEVPPSLPVPEPFGFKMSVGRRRVLFDERMRSIPFTFRAMQEPEPGPKWQGVFEQHWARVPAVVPRRGRGGASVLRDLGEDAARAHAGAVPGLRAPGGALGRRRPRSPDALDLQAAALPRRLHAGRVDTRRPPGARPELRLLALPSRGAGLAQPSPRPASDRDERLPLGCARRDERGRAGGFAHVRGAPRARATGSESP